MHIVNLIKQFARDEEGVVAIEYGILASVVAITTIAIGNLLSDSATGLPSVFSALLADLTTQVDSIVP